MMTVDDVVLDAAPSYVGDGISVIPVVGKRPALLAWQRWQTNLTPEDMVHAWFISRDRRDLTFDARQHLDGAGTLNVATVTGAISRVFVLDVDTHGATSWYRAAAFRPMLRAY